jgi:hypothetical protein
LFCYIAVLANCLLFFVHGRFVSFGRSSLHHRERVLRCGQCLLQLLSAGDNHRRSVRQGIKPRLRVWIPWRGTSARIELFACRCRSKARSHRRDGSATLSIVGRHLVGRLFDHHICCACDPDKTETIASEEKDTPGPRSQNCGPPSSRTSAACR